MRDEATTARAIDHVTRGLITGRAFHGPILRVVFAAANVARDVRHGLPGVIPDGFEVLFTDGVVHATPGRLWSTDLAYLQATTANTRAVIRFLVLREDVFDA